MREEGSHPSLLIPHPFLRLWNKRSIMASGYGFDVLGGLSMPTTITISLDPELREALERKSRQLHQDPETTVVRLIRQFVEGRLLLADQEFAEGLTVAEIRHSPFATRHSPLAK